MQMLLESSVFRTQQVTKTPCATAVAARARARAASAGHVRGLLMNYKNDDDFIQGRQIGVDIARRETRLFSLFFSKSFFSNAKGGFVNGLRIRLSTYPFFLFPFLFPQKKGEAAADGEEKRVTPGLTSRDCAF
jgi:hypothetical protein